MTQVPSREGSTNSGAWAAQIMSDHITADLPAAPAQIYPDHRFKIFSAHSSAMGIFTLGIVTPPFNSGLDATPLGASTPHGKLAALKALRPSIRRMLAPVCTHPLPHALNLPGNSTNHIYICTCAARHPRQLHKSAYLPHCHQDRFSARPHPAVYMIIAALLGRLYTKGTSAVASELCLGGFILRNLVTKIRARRTGCQTACIPPRGWQ